MHTACAHLVLVGTRTGTRFAPFVLLDVSESETAPGPADGEATPAPHLPAREPAPGEAGAEFAISHLVQHLE